MNSGEMGKKTINQYRAKMSDDCDIFAEKKMGFIHFQCLQGEERPYQVYVML